MARVSVWIKFVLGLLVLTTFLTEASKAQNLIDRLTRTERHETAKEAWDACIKHKADFESFMTGRSFCHQPSNYRREKNILHVYVAKEHSENGFEGVRTITRWFYYNKYDSGFMVWLLKRKDW